MSFGASRHVGITYSVLPSSPIMTVPFGASLHVVSLIRFSHYDGCRLVHPDTWYHLFGLPSCRMLFGASRHVVSLIRFSHHDGCRLVHPDTWYQLNVIRHQDECRLVHPAKWDIGKFRGAFMTDADLCIPSSGSFDISINSHL